MTENKAGKKRDKNWIAVLWYIHLHVLGAYGFFLLLVSVKWMTALFLALLLVISFLGMTAGAHRLWAHRSYTASFPVRLFLVVAHSFAGVGSIHNWVLYHRIHHKHYGTEKDPYQHEKGFWHSHIFSNILTQHPDKDVIEKTIDMRDVELDTLVWIQHKFYYIIFVLLAVLIPINTPAEYWDEDLVNSFLVLGFFRLAVTMNISWLINSGPTIWGLGEKDKFPPDDNYVFILNRSFWPRYHYLMPWDWKTGEFGSYEKGLATFIIKMWFELGLVKELKTNSSEDVQEALYELAVKRATLQKSLNALKEKAEVDALHANFQYHH